MSFISKLEADVKAAFDKVRGDVRPVVKAVETDVRVALVDVKAKALAELVAHTPEIEAAAAKALKLIEDAVLVAIETHLV